MFLYLFISPAWAIGAPGINFNVDIGSISSWVGIIMTAVVMIQQYYARRETKDVKEIAVASVAAIKAVSVQVDGITTERVKAGKEEGKKESKEEGEAKAQTLLEGIELGRTLGPATPPPAGPERVETSTEESKK